MTGAPYRTGMIAADKNADYLCNRWKPLDVASISAYREYVDSRTASRRHDISNFGSSVLFRYSRSDDDIAPDMRLSYSL